MPYIQKIKLRNRKEILFCLTDKEFESFKNSPFEREYKHEKSYLYYDISNQEKDFEYISDSIYKLIKNTGSIIRLNDPNIDVKSKNRRSYEYVAERIMTHGDADFDTNEVFIIDEDTFNMIEENGGTVTFEVYDKTSNYSFSEEFAFDSDDFDKRDNRFSIHGNTDFKISFDTDSFIDDFLKNNEENLEKKQSIGSNCYFHFAFDYENETDIYSFLINKYQFEFYEYFAKVCNYYFENNHNKKEREFHIASALGIIGTDYFKGETYYLDFNPKENYERACSEDELDEIFTKEIYDRYYEHTMKNVLPKIKEEFPYYYETFRLEETIPAFFEGVTLHQFYDKSWE